METGSSQHSLGSQYLLTFTLSACVALILFSSGCQQWNKPPQYQNRTIPESVHPVLVDADLSQRFGARRATQETSSTPELKYDLPKGWTELPVTSMRRMNLRIAGDPQTECYLTVFQGGGSLRDNIDRWCQQMGKDPLPDDEVAALPKAQLLGMEGVRVEIDGNFDGGMSSAAVEDARMIVYVLPLGGATVFLKATGPRELLITEAAALTQFVEGLSLAQSPPAQSAAQSTAQAPTSSPLTWDIPEGWTTLGKKPMREVTFVAGTEARCWITILGGDGGGTLANVNRWRNEMGQPPLNEADLETLPKVPMLNGQAYVVEATGSYSSMGSTAEDDWAMIGLIRNLSGRAIFIKLVGPNDEVEAARSALEFLAQSLKESE